MNIETSIGTMRAEAWHSGKMIAADPSGFNWRIINEEVDNLIEGIKKERTLYCRRGRSGVFVQPSANGGYTIIASDVDIDNAFTTTQLTPKGVQQFLSVLEEALGRENIPMGI